MRCVVYRLYTHSVEHLICEALSDAPVISTRIERVISLSTRSGWNQQCCFFSRVESSILIYLKRGVCMCHGVHRRRDVVDMERGDADKTTRCRVYQL